MGKTAASKKTETFKCCRNDNSRDTCTSAWCCHVEWKRTLEKKNRIYEEQSESLTQQINEQQQRQKELEEYKKYVKTKKFVEEVAKNKFGLLYPDEILIKPDD